MYHFSCCWHSKNCFEGRKLIVNNYGFFVAINYWPQKSSWYTFYIFDSECLYTNKLNFWAVIVTNFEGTWRLTAGIQKLLSCFCLFRLSEEFKRLKLCYTESFSSSLHPLASCYDNKPPLYLGLYQMNENVAYNTNSIWIYLWFKVLQKFILLCPTDKLFSSSFLRKLESVIILIQYNSSLPSTLLSCLQLSFIVANRVKAQNNEIPKTYLQKN